MVAGDSRDGELNDDADASNLALRMDNLNLSGFTNKLGDWFAFDDQAHLITDATPLGFTGAYGDLVGGYLNLRDLRLGRDAIREALRVLASYVARTGDKEQLKRALAVIIVTICEAARFPRLREKIAAGWLAGTYLTPEEVEYVDNWEIFSCAILIDARYGQWRSSRPSTSEVCIRLQKKSIFLFSLNTATDQSTCTDHQYCACAAASSCNTPFLSGEE